MIERRHAGGLSASNWRLIPTLLRHACGYALANKWHDTRAIQGRTRVLVLADPLRCVQGARDEGAGLGPTASAKALGIGRGSVVLEVWRASF
jgi:hypothetical protein